MTVVDSVVARWFLIISVTAFIQIAFASDFQPFGTHPDLLLLIGVAAGLAGGEARGATVGFICGLLIDLLSVGTLGVTALAFAVTGYIVGRVSQMLLDASWLTHLGIIALGSLGGVIMQLGITTLLGGDAFEHNSVWSSVMVITILNSVLALPALRAAMWAQQPQAHQPRHGIELRRD